MDGDKVLGDGEGKEPRQTIGLGRRMKMREAGELMSIKKRRLGCYAKAGGMAQATDKGHGL